MKQCTAPIPSKSIGSLFFVLALVAASAQGELRTWDGKYPIDKIEVNVVYFVPRDRTPLADWRRRVDYFCRRIERFHQRELDGQSQLATKVYPEPFRSPRTSEQLRSGDADFIFFQTLREVDDRLHVGRGDRDAFPILLVLSDINWQPLDDFFRLRKKETRLEFDGQLIDGRHFPGSPSGGARATYLADRGVGWGLVSADGWRVPYRGSDCVVYHEGVGHTVGLPHPEPGDGSVMSLGQYRGWLSESWLDEPQKTRLGWSRPKKPFDRAADLFSTFRAVPEPAMPKPGEKVTLKLDWPAGAQISQCDVSLQTELAGPWTRVPNNSANGNPPVMVDLGTFDRPTPVGYRVEVEIESSETEELWGYFQVREQPDRPPLPSTAGQDLSVESRQLDTAGEEVDLLPLIDVDRDRVSGEWNVAEGRLTSPKAYGARIEVPYQPPAEYRLTVVAEPLDEPNGLILGQRLGGHRFLVLLNFMADDQSASALENVDGKNVGANSTTTRTPLFKRGRPSEIIAVVRQDSVEVSVDGRTIVTWRGDADRLSLSDYWQTPTDNALFVGAYDCRYRISRLTLEPLSGTGKVLKVERQNAQTP